MQTFSFIPNHSTDNRYRILSRGRLMWWPKCEHQICSTIVYTLCVRASERACERDWAKKKEQNTKHQRRQYRWRERERLAEQHPQQQITEIIVLILNWMRSNTDVNRLKLLIGNLVCARYIFLFHLSHGWKIDIFYLFPPPHTIEFITQMTYTHTAARTHCAAWIILRTSFMRMYGACTFYCHWYTYAYAYAYMPIARVHEIYTLNFLSTHGKYNAINPVFGFVEKEKRHGKT